MAVANSERMIRVEPAFFYRGANPALPQVDTPEEARSQWIAWYTPHCVSRVPQIEGYCTFGALQPEFDYGTTINGVSSRYLFTFTHVSIDYRVSPPYTSYVTNWTAVQSFYRCPVSFAFVNFPPYAASQSAYCRKALPTFEPANCPRTDNPILIATGTKLAIEIDYSDPGGMLRVERIYRSDYPGFAAAAHRRLIDYSANGPQTISVLAVIERNAGEYLARHLRLFGAGAHLALRGLPNEVQVIAPAQDLRSLGFREMGGTFIADLNQNYRLRRLLSGQGALLGWVLTSPDNVVETYDAQGLVRARQTAQGAHTEFLHSNGRLVRMDDAFGRSVQFEYDSFGRVTGFQDPAGRRVSYIYQGVAQCVGVDCNNIASVTYPDTASRSYRYNEPELTGGAHLPHALTGVIDENGWRLASYRYNSLNEAIGANRWSAASVPVDSVSITGSTNIKFVTDARGTQRRYAFGGSGYQRHLASLNQPAGAGCGPASAFITYDTQDNVSDRTDFNNSKVCYAYDLSRNLETKRVEGSTASAACSSALSSPPTGARVISTQWHPDWRLETRIAEPKKLTTITYNGQGATCAPSTVLIDGKPPAVICTRAEQATTDETGASGFAAPVTGTARTWRYTYTTYGRVLTATDPNNRVTTTSYHADNDADLGKRGNVASITNAANHTTYVTDYNPHGQPTRIVDPNGVVTVLTYDPRMRLTSRTVGNEATVFGYDPVGQMTSVNLPDGARLTYTYDAAHRLTAINDHKGNRIDYTLDAMGNRITEKTKDPAGVLVGNIARVIDALNRVERITGATQW